MGCVFARTTACDWEALDGRHVRAIRRRVRGFGSLCVVSENRLVEADQLRLCTGGRLGYRGVGEALCRRLGRAFAIRRVWGRCEGCAGRERIRCDKLGILQLQAC